MNTIPIALFRIGRITATPGILAKLSPPEIVNLIRRHQAGDWGDVEEEDRNANDLALEKSSRLVSIYQMNPDLRVYVITEANRAYTTVLLPQEY
jgi:hypothetical protein